MSIELGTALVRKWQPRFGFADWRIYVRPGFAEQEAQAASYWMPSDKWGVVWVPDDGEYPIETLELLVLHELVHAVLWEGEALIETQCDVLARALQDNADARWPDEVNMLRRSHQEFWHELEALRETAKRGVEKRPWLAIVVDGLPKVERDVVTALYWEGLSIREVAARLGIPRMNVVRRRDAALRRLRKAFDALDRKFAKEGEE